MTIETKYNIGDEVCEIKPKPNNEGMNWIVDKIHPDGLDCSWRSKFKSSDRRYRRPQRKTFQFDEVVLIKKAPVEKLRDLIGKRDD